MAQSVSLRGERPCPELGVKPTGGLNARTSQFDPRRTSQVAQIMLGQATELRFEGMHDSPAG
jgi:hypothetical protein